jgi:hypothetical protein
MAFVQFLYGIPISRLQFAYSRNHGIRALKINPSFLSSQKARIPLGSTVCFHVTWPRSLNDCPRKWPPLHILTSGVRPRSDLGPYIDSIPIPSFSKAGPEFAGSFAENSGKTLSLGTALYEQTRVMSLTSARRACFQQDIAAGLQVSFQMSPTMAFQSSVERKMGRCDLTDEARRDRSRTNWAVCETLLIPASAKRQYCHVRESCHADEPGPPFHYRSGEKRDQMWDDRVRASASGRTQTSAKDDMQCSQNRSSSNPIEA